MAQQLDISRDCRTAQQLSTSLHRSARSAQRLRTEHEMLQRVLQQQQQQSSANSSAAAAAAGRHRPTLRLACVRQPALYPACYSLRAWSGRIPRAFCILSLLLLLLFHIVAADGWRWLTTTTNMSSSSRKHSAFMRSLQLTDILIQSTPSGPLDL